MHSHATPARRDGRARHFIWRRTVAALGTLMVVLLGAAAPAAAQSGASAAHYDPPSAAPTAHVAPPPAADTAGHKPLGLRLALAYSDVAGNQTLRVLTGSAALKRPIGSFNLGAETQARRGTTDGEVAIERYTGALSIEVRSGGALTPFIDSQFERDLPKKVRLRVNAGAGARYHMLNRPGLQISSSAALLYSHESLLADAGVRPVDARWLFRLEGTARPGEMVTVHHETGYRPAYSDFGAYLLTAKTEMDVRLTRTLGLNVSYEVDRNSDPPVDVQPQDRLFAVGFDAGF